MSLNPKRLADLLAIAEHGSFSRAATALRVSQPALSLSMSVLEKELGVRVLIRERKGVRLTDYGEILVRSARSLQSTLGQAQEEIRLAQLDTSGPLAVGASPAGAAILIPQALALLSQDRRRYSISIIEGLDDSLIDLMRAGKIDMMVGPLNVDPPLSDIEDELLIRDRFMVIMRPDHPARRQESLSLLDLRDARWVLPETGGAFRRQVDALFVAAGAQLPIDCVSTNSINAIKSIVAQTDYLSIMSDDLASADVRAGLLRAVPLSEFRRPRLVGIRRRRDVPLSSVALRFLQALRIAAKATRKPRRKA